jgi:crotonobetainyl-CoA:carnitine CoA-transferase CaiB-like acyl-CoA transferase
LNLGEWGLGFGSNDIRLEKRIEVMKKLTEKIAAVERDALIAALDEVEVPIGPVNDVAEILSDPHVRARGLVSSFDYPGVGEFKALGLPYKFLGWDNPVVGAPPVLGADTEQVLKERLGYTDERIAGLKKSHAI